MSIKVTVVVAAYNLESYIARCLSSVSNQTLKDIEIIVVNDGSTDETGQIVECFSDTDPRIRVINQENGGLSAARNTGLRHAQGEFVAFLDGDDFVDPTMYESLYSAIQADSAEMAVCGYCKLWEEAGGQTLKTQKHFFDKRLIHGDLINQFLARHDEAYVVVWNKLFKRALIADNGLYFENRAFFEDAGFIPTYLKHITTIAVVQETLHYYVQRSGSITKSVSPIIKVSLENTLAKVTGSLGNRSREPHLKAFQMRLLIYTYNY